MDGWSDVTSSRRISGGKVEDAAQRPKPDKSVERADKQGQLGLWGLGAPS